MERTEMYNCANIKMGAVTKPIAYFLFMTEFALFLGYKKYVAFYFCPLVGHLLLFSINKCADEMNQ